MKKAILIGLGIISLLVLSGCVVDDTPKWNDAKQFDTCDNELGCCDENPYECTPLTGGHGDCWPGKKAVHMFGGSVRGYLCVSGDYKGVNMILLFPNSVDSNTKLVANQYNDMCDFCIEQGLTHLRWYTTCDYEGMWDPKYPEGFPDDYKFICRDLDRWDDVKEEFYSKTYEYGDVR